MYFDQNDELVEERVAEADPNNYYHKYHMVEIDFKQEYDDDDDEDIQMLEDIVMRGGDKGKAAMGK